jgi:hypothetical protein
VVRDDQPEAREGQAGRPGEAERFMVLTKPGNAGGEKGPQFKTNAIRSEGPGDWATYQLRRVFRNCRRRCTRKRRQKPAIGFTPCTTRSAARTFWPRPMPSAAPTGAHRVWTVRICGNRRVRCRAMAWRTGATTPRCSCAGRCVPSTRSGDVRAGLIHSRTSTGTSGSYA